VTLALDPATNSVLRIFPDGNVDRVKLNFSLGAAGNLGFDNGNDRLYLIDTTIAGAGIAVLDASAFTLEQILQLPNGIGPVSGLAVLGEELFLLEAGTGRLHVLDAGSGALLRTRDLGERFAGVAGGLAADSDLKRLYVPMADGGIAAVNAGTGIFIETLPLPQLSAISGMTVAGSEISIASGSRVLRYTLSGQLLGTTDLGTVSGGLASAVVPAEIEVVVTQVQSTGEIRVKIPDKITLQNSVIRVGLPVNEVVVTQGSDPKIQPPVITPGTGPGTPPDTLPPGSRPNAAYSDPVRPNPTPENYIVVTNSGENTITIIKPALIKPGSGTEGSGVLGKIVVGKNPTDVVISPDGFTAYVVNLGDGTLSVIDLIKMTEVDFKPSTPELDRLDFGAGSRPFYIAARPSARDLGISELDKTVELAITDRDRPVVYYVALDLDGRALFPTSVPIPGAAKVTGLTGLDYSVDGETLYVASPGEGSFAGRDRGVGLAEGRIFVIDADSRALVEVLATNPKPFGVTRSPIKPKLGEISNLTIYADQVGVAVRASERTGVTLISDLTRQVRTIATTLRGEEPLLPTATSLALPRSDEFRSLFFEINNAESMVFSTDVRYAYVLFNATPDPASSDLGRDPFFGRGSNIGVLRNPFGFPDMARQASSRRRLRCRLASPMRLPSMAVSNISSPRIKASIRCMSMISGSCMLRSTPLRTWTRRCWRTRPAIFNTTSIRSSRSLAFPEAIRSLFGGRSARRARGPK
jgi:DNA-binding beta-propeller fold protein YncE